MKDFRHLTTILECLGLVAVNALLPFTPVGVVPYVCWESDNIGWRAVTYVIVCLAVALGFGIACRAKKALKILGALSAVNVIIFFAGTIIVSMAFIISSFFNPSIRPGSNYMNLPLGFSVLIPGLAYTYVGSRMIKFLNADEVKDVFEAKKGE